MGCGKKAWAEEQEALVYQEALARVEQITSTRLLASLEDIKRDLQDMVDANIHMTKVNHQRLDDALDEVKQLLRGK